MLKSCATCYHVVIVTNSRFWGSFTLALFVNETDARRWAREHADDYIYPLVIIRG